METSATVMPAARRPTTTRGGPFAPAAAAAPSTHRGLRCDSYSRASSGVWYYQVDIEIRRVRSVEVSSSSLRGYLETCDEDDAQYYSVRRRYNEFLQLYESIKEKLTQGAGDVTALPPFPQKELISSSMLGMLWRMSSPVDVLDDRRAKFEALLRWIEADPALRDCVAFTDFLGQPPQSLEGYVSLKEYSSQHWLSSLEQLTKEKAKRRRLSSDCSTCSVLQQEKARGAKKRRHVTQEVRLLSPSARAKASKRPRLCDSKSTRSKQSPAHVRAAKKRTRASSTSSTPKDQCDSSSLQLSLHLGEAQRAVAQVESNQFMKKKKKIC